MMERNYRQKDTVRSSGHRVLSPREDFIMRDRIYKLSLVAAVLAVLLCGCSNNREKKKETSDVPVYTLEEIRAEAETVKKKYGSMDFSKAEIIILEGEE